MMARVDAHRALGVRRLWIGLVVVVVAALCVVAAALVAPSAARAASAGCVGTATITCTYASTGAEQTFVVPAGVTSIHVVAIGGKGGSGTGSISGCCGASGGFGDQVSGDLAVTAGATLYVEVGGNGASVGAGGFNGGGSSPPAPAYGGAAAAAVAAPPTFARCRTPTRERSLRGW